MPRGSILVVDDDKQVQRVMRVSLREEGYEAECIRTGEEALERIQSGKFDLVLLDINLPGISGLSACRQIRSFSEIPIIMMTVRHTEKDKVEALDLGADDYVEKPFGMPEMLARIRAALRRTIAPPAAAASNLRLGEIDIDFQNRRVVTPKEQVRLTSKEFDLLSYFAAHPNRPISHEELLQAVWGRGYERDFEYLRVFVNRLRKKIEPSPAHPKYLLKEPWFGYRFNVPSN
jgi:two-component system, OmpR family, KDP operon response regulator KdpE